MAALFSFAFWLTFSCAFWLLDTFKVYSLSFAVVDKLSWALCLLCVLVWLNVLLCYGRYVVSFKPSYLVGVLVLLFSVALFFCATSVFWFFVLFEAYLPGILLLILGFGYQPERTVAAQYLLFYSTFFSMPFVYGVRVCGVPLLFTCCVGPTLCLLQCALFCGVFMVKYPIYFVHLWLPRAHVEAPVSGSIILAAVLLKLGVYGFYRFALLFALQVGFGV